MFKLALFKSYHLVIHKSRFLKNFIYIVFCLLPAFAVTQSLRLNLDTCLALSRNHFPAIHQLQLITQSEKYTLSNITKAWWPQLTALAQASYQSDVTHLDIRIPNFPLPEAPDKDQYKVIMDINQLVYDGGLLAAQKKIASTSSQIEILRTETELYKIKERVMQLYFGNLLIRQQLKSVQLLSDDIDIQIKKAESALKAKVISANNLYVLQAEKIKVNQRMEELVSIQSQWLLMMSQFIDIPLDKNTQFEMPETPVLHDQIKRPELALINQQIDLLDSQNKLQSSQKSPRLSAFAQLAYASPGLNFLRNGFQSNYIGGIRFSWNLSSFYTQRNNHRILANNKNLASLQKETFAFNTELQLIQQREEIRKYQALLNDDLQLIELRKKIAEAAKIQLENNIITTSDFLQEITAEEQARTNALVHQIQYLQSMYLYNYYSGN